MRFDNLELGELTTLQRDLVAAIDKAHAARRDKIKGDVIGMITAAGYKPEDLFPMRRSHAVPARVKHTVKRSADPKRSEIARAAALKRWNTR